MGITQIIKRNGKVINLNTKEPFCIVKSATQNSSLMGDDYITLQIVSSEWLSFEKGDKIIVDGFDYTIRTTTKREIQADNYYIFEPVFYGPMYDLMKTIYRNCDKDGKSDRNTFDLTYTIKEFVQVIINNLNRDYPGLWAFDENNCPETEAKTIQFSGANCLQALQSLCSKDNFNLEFLISQENGVRTIHIGKFGQRVNPPGGADYFEWGKGNGLYKLTEQKIDDKAIITRLWVEGGTSNIRTNYRDYSERLQLPYPRRYNRNKHTLFDGSVIEPNTEIIGISDDSKRYIEDEALRDKIGSEEDVKTYDEIYPTRTGHVTALVEGDIYSFIDDTMDFDLCEKDANGTKYLVDSVSAKITFTSGRLAGQQFELEAKSGYDHTTKKFKLIPFTDKRGLTTPTVSVEQGGAYPIEVGATYKITDIFLPESYEQNAEEELWYAGYNDFKPATQAKAQYSLTLDRLYFLEALSSDSEVCLFKVGDYVPVKDSRYGIEKQIRIQKITRNLLLEQDYQLTLSDTTAINIQTQTTLSVIEHDQIITNNRLRDLNKARRGWRTTEDLRNMVYDTDGFFDVDNIRPNSIDTNMLTVGSKSQQFVLTGVILQANVGGNPNAFTASTGILSHLTIDPSKIRVWQMNELAFTIDNTAGYYLFAKCSKDGETGTWLLTQTQYKFEPTDDPNNYYFLVGVLSSLYPDDNFRDFQTTYGFTRINGNTITTGRIETSDGECYLDLDGNKFRIGDTSSSIDWNVSRKKTITLKNVSVVSESGDVSPLGVFRGIWNIDYTYYTNDEVTYTENGATCTYRYTHPSPSKGHRPTESVYWGVIAKGADGANGKDGINGVDGENGKDGINGDFTEYRYATSGSKSAAPPLTPSDRAPYGWSTAMPPVDTLKYLWLTTAIINGESNELREKWSTPIRVTPYDGVDGKDGESPVLVFRGKYDSSKTYYGNSQRIDAVKYDNHFYIARIDAGSFYNILPTNTSKWNDFGAEFETIATNLLLAEGANIGDWFIQNGQIVSTIDESLKNRIMLQVGVYSGNTLIYQPKIVLESEISGGSNTMQSDRGIGSTITLDATQGIVETRSKDDSSVSYMSPAGFFANKAGQEAMSAVLGRTYRAAIVGLGFANVNKEDWQIDIEQPMIAGIYGRALNRGTAPAFGGYFQRLFAGGLVLGRKAIVDSSSNINYLSSNDTMVVGYNSSEEIVYLPSDPYEGQVIFFKQWWTGYMRIKPRTGHHIYDDHAENDYIDISEGYTGMLVFSVGYLTSGSTTTKTEAWISSRWKGNV